MSEDLFSELGRRLGPFLAAQRSPLDPRPVPAKICGPLEAAREILPAALLPLRHDAPADLAIAIAIFFCVDPPAESEIARVRAKLDASISFRASADELFKR